MNGTHTHTPVVYETANQELRTVRFFFREQNDMVLSIQWEPGIRAGTVIQPNQKLAVIKWEMQAPQDIVAPPGCNGTIEKTNRRIDYGVLTSDSERLLSLQLT